MFYKFNLLKFLIFTDCRFMGFEELEAEIALLRVAQGRDFPSSVVPS